MTIGDESTMRAPRIRAIKRGKAGRGAAAVELAVVLPVLVFLSMATVDFARLVNVQLTLQNCARNGALYEFYTQANLSLPSGWTSLSLAVNAGVPSGMTVTATATSPAASSNNYVTVTTTSIFKPIAMPAMHGLPSLPGSVTLSQSAMMPYPASASPVP